MPQGDPDAVARRTVFLFVLFALKILGIVTFTKRTVVSVPG